jgi:hypothetical protein
LTLSFVSLRASETVTWIKVDRPTFDLVGVVLSSLGLAGICAGVALTLGAVLGIGFIVRGRRAPSPLSERLSLHLLQAPPH